MILLALALANSFTFAGGSDSDLVAAIGAATDRNIVYEFSPWRVWPKANFTYSSQWELGVVLKRRYQVQFPDGQRVGSSKGIGNAWDLGPYPDLFLYKQHMDQYVSYSAPLQLPKLSWPLSLKPKQAKYATIQQIERLCKKPLKVHWFFNDARLVLDVHDCPEDVLLSLIAKTLGGKLVDKGTSWYLDFDPAAFRTKAEKTYQDQIDHPQNRFALLDAKYMAALYGFLTNNQIEAVYEKPQNEIEIRIAPGTELETMAKQRLYLRAGPLDDPAKLTEAQRAGRDSIFKNADFNKGWWALVKSNGVPACMLKAKDGINWRCVF